MFDDLKQEMDHQESALSSGNKTSDKALEQKLHELEEELRIERSKREKLEEKLQAFNQKSYDPSFATP